MEKYTFLLGIALVTLSVFLQVYFNIERFTDASGNDVSGNDVSGNNFVAEFAELIKIVAPRLKIAPEGEEPIDITIQKVWSTDLNDVQSYLESKYNKVLSDRATTPLSTTTTDTTLSPILAQGRESQGK
jgi:hypothetical protein